MLVEHARLHAERVAARLGGPLSAENLAQFLTDSNCLRWCTEIVFDATPLEPHQFAQPIIGGPEHLRTCTLYVHPRFAQHPAALPFFVAYFAAVINYGIAAGPDLCEAHGAALLGMKEDAFYAALCAAVDVA